MCHHYRVSRYCMIMTLSQMLLYLSSISGYHNTPEAISSLISGEVQFEISHPQAPMHSFTVRNNSELSSSLSGIKVLVLNV